MLNRYVQLALLGTCLLVQAGVSNGGSAKARPRCSQGSSSQQVNPVVQWNRALLAIVRTPGAQSATVHPTRSFAILHAAIYDAVNAIDRKHRPYLVRLSSVPGDACQDAAVAAEAHEVLVALYPAFKAKLDTQLQQSLAQIPDGSGKVEGVLIGQTVAARILGARRN